MENFFKRLKNNNSINQETKRYNLGNFQNDDLSLKFVFSGKQAFKINKQNFEIHPDCFLIINKGTIYESIIQSDNYVKFCSISFDANFINDVKNTLTRSTAYLLENPTQKDILSYDFPETLLPLKSNLHFNLHHIKSFIKNDLNDDFLLEEYLHHTFINYFEIYNHDIRLAENRLKCLKNHTKKEVIKRLNLAKDYIYYNYNKQIELKDIAENSYLSINHLLRTFKQAHGESPHQFLTKLRLRRANHLIKNTSISINEVVSMVGFECPSSFIRLYKSHYNFTPAKFRKLN